jgi:hypothetical protein
MYLELKDNKYNLLDLDYEMLQLVINGIDCEKRSLIDKIAHLTTYLFKDSSLSQKEQFKVQIEYLKDKNDELTELLMTLKEQMENIPLLNKNPQHTSGDNLT